MTSSFISLLSSSPQFYHPVPHLLLLAWHFSLDGPSPENSTWPRSNFLSFHLNPPLPECSTHLPANNISLCPVEQVRNLRCFFVSLLYFITHIQFVAKFCCFFLCIVKIIVLPVGVLGKIPGLHSSNLPPQLRQPSPLWSFFTLGPLSSIQHSAAKIIYLFHWSAPMTPLFISLHQLSVHSYV